MLINLIPHMTYFFTIFNLMAVPVLTTTGGVFFLDQSVRLLQVLGIAVVLGALSLVIRREAQLVGTDDDS